MSLYALGSGHFQHSLHDRGMKTIMKLDNLKTIAEMEAFLAGNQPIAFAVASSKDERYQFVEDILKRFRYAQLKRREKSAVIKFLRKISGYSRQQLTRMIERHNERGVLQRFHKTINGFEQIYQSSDIRLLAELDQRHDTPNGFRVKKLCERAYHEFDEQAYQRLSSISVSHIYNLRKSAGYKKIRVHYEKTKSPKGVHIGERRKPYADGKPGYIRIDTVHQGDYDGQKGVYHINAVDEFTQFEIIATVEKISEAYLLPVLKIMLDSFPFKIINFHSDNGSEYINALNPYINYHRPCLYPTITTDSKGKEKKKYKYEDMMTPYQKLKSIREAASYLKEGVTFQKCDDIAYAMTDNQSADYLKQQRALLFKFIHEDCKKRA